MGRREYSMVKIRKVIDQSDRSLILHIIHTSLSALTSCRYCDLGREVPFCADYRSTRSKRLHFQSCCGYHAASQRTACRPAGHLCCQCEHSHAADSKGEFVRIADLEALNDAARCHEGQVWGSRAAAMATLANGSSGPGVPCRSARMVTRPAAPPHDRIEPKVPVTALCANVGHQ